MIARSVSLILSNHLIEIAQKKESETLRGLRIYREPGCAVSGILEKTFGPESLDACGVRHHVRNHAANDNFIIRPGRGRTKSRIVQYAMYKIIFYERHLRDSHDSTI